MEIKLLMVDCFFETLAQSIHEFLIRENIEPPRPHKDPFYHEKCRAFERLQDLRAALLLAIMCNVYAAAFNRRMMFHKSGFLARVAKRKQNRI